jgi:Glyoxalase/Bleomycin resistance protein/Dioxygenase superfamily
MPIAVSGNDITLRRRHAYTRMRCTRVCPAESLGNNCLSGKEASWVSIELLWEQTMTDQLIGAHNGLHSEQGSLSGEHPGRSANPVIKVHDVVWLEFEKPDLNKAEEFGLAFGFSVVLRTDDELHLRGSDPGAPCVLIRRGPRSRFVGPAFVTVDHSDLLRLADATGATVRALPESLGGVAVDLVDPSGIPLKVVSGVHELPGLPSQQPHIFNFGPSHDIIRANSTQRPPRVAANVQRLGHIVLQTPKYIEALNWYLDHLGLIVSDFCYYPGQRERGPVMSFIRCDRGSVPADHHTLAMALGPTHRYVHSAYQVADLDALAAGGEYLREQGYFRSWGIGRHIQGSQIFDYWRDPEGDFLVEHFADGDMFDNTLEPGWAPLTSSGLAQWGPPPSKDFLGVGTPGETAREVALMLDALRHDNEFDLSALRGLFNVANS